MAQTKAETKKAKTKRRPTGQQQEGSTLLGLELPVEVKRRLDILTEDSDLETVLSAALLLLWDQRYPRQPSRVQPTPEAGEPAETPPAPESAEESSAADLVEPTETPPSAMASEEETTSVAPMSDREAILDRIQALHADGVSLTAIAAQLNQEGVPTISGSGRWHHSAVKRLLRKA
jgi:hypothetical protein